MSASNPWDVSDILLQNRAGQIWGQGIANLGQAAGQAIQQYGEMKKQDNLFKAKSTSIERTIKAHPELWGGKEAVDQLLAQNPNETPMARYTRLSDDITNKITANKLSEMASTARAKSIEAEAIKAMSNPMFAAEQAALGGAKFGSIPQAQNLDAFSRLNQYVSAGGSDPNLINAMTNLQNTNIKANQPPKKTTLEQNVDYFLGLGFPREKAIKLASPGGVNINTGNTVTSKGEIIEVDENGKPVRLVPLPGSEAERERTKTNVAREGVGAGVLGMTNALVNLYKQGAVSSPTQTPGENILSKARSSPIGRFVEGAVGSEAESFRQTYNNLQPRVVSEIRAAYEQSSKAMDSNRELEFYLQQTGSPDADIVSSAAALYNIIDRFGNKKEATALLRSLPPELKKMVLPRIGELKDEAPEGNMDSGPTDSGGFGSPNFLQQLQEEQKRRQQAKGGK